MAKKKQSLDVDTEFDEVDDTQLDVDMQFDEVEFDEPVKKKSGPQNLQLGFGTPAEALSSSKSNLGSDPLRSTPSSVKKLDEFNRKYGTNYTPAQIQGKEPIPDPIGAGEAMGRNLLGATSNLFAATLNTPKYLQRMLANPILEIAGMDEEAKRAFFEMQDENPMAPTSALGKIAKIYQEDAKRFMAPVQQQYKESVTELIDKGDLTGAAKKVGIDIAASLPATLGIIAATMAGVPAAAITGGSGVVFGSQEYQDIDPNSPMTEGQKVVGSLGKGLVEGVFEQIGTGSLTKQVAKKIMEDMGADQGRKVIEKTYLTAAKQALRPYFPVTAPLQEALTEGATQLAQNFIDSQTDTSKADMNIMDGVADAALVGGIMGGVFGAAPSVPITVSNIKSKTKGKEVEAKIQAIDAELDNDDVSEAAKQALVSERSGLISQANDLIEQDREALEAVPEEQKRIIGELANQHDEVDAALADPALSDTSREVLEQKKQVIENEQERIWSEAIKETPQDLPADDPAGASLPGEGVSTEEIEGATHKPPTPEANDRILLPHPSGRGYIKLPTVYIRFGEPLKDDSGNVEASGNYLRGGKELGVSVYRAFYDKKSGNYILQGGDEGYEATQQSFDSGKRKAYIVTGKVIGNGADGEPLIDPSTFKELSEIPYSRLTSEIVGDIDIEGKEMANPPSYTEEDAMEQIASNGDTQNNGEDQDKREGQRQDVLTPETPAGDENAPAVELSDEQKGADNEDAVSRGFKNAPHAINSVNKRREKEYTAYAQITKDLLDEVGKERIPPPSDEQEQSPPPGKGKREFTRKFLENKSIREDIKQAVSEDEEAVYYNRLPNDLTEREANEIVQTFGVDGAVRIFKEPGWGISTPVKNALGFAIINTLNDNKEYAKAAEVALDIERGVAEAGTEAAQSLQSFKIWYRMHPASAVIHAQKIVREQFAEKAKKDKPLRKIKKKVAEINEQVADEVVKRLEDRIEKAAKVSPKDVARQKYGDRNRIVTKDRYSELKKKLKGKVFSGVDPEMIEFAVYHLEASGRKFSDFASNMAKDLGAKIRPYLKVLYDKAKKQLETGGYEDFEAAEAVDAQFSAMLTKPIKEGLKDLNVRIREVIQQHYTVQDFTGRTLAQKLVEETGLEGAEAKDLADAVQAEFNRLATAAKQSMLRQALGDKKVVKSDLKELEDEVIKLTNLGAFSDEELTRAYAKKMGYPELTEENVKQIERLANKVQEAPDGFQKDERIQDLLAYQANLKGIDWKDLAMAIWYANILSDIGTQGKNVVSNTVNSMSLMASAMMQNPTYSKEFVSAYLNGIKRGLLEGGQTIRTGYGPIRGKAEVPNILERQKFTGFGKTFQYYKYVRRVMVAADVVTYEAVKEMRAYQLALKQSIKDNKLDPSISVRDRAAQMVQERDFQQQVIRERVALELSEKIEAIEQQNIAPSEKKKAIETAQRESKRRIYELTEQGRPASIVEDSHSFAKRATYNMPPEGVLGAATNGVNYVLGKIPFARLIVPFTNIICNVANESINYSPFGFVAAERGGGVILKAKNFTEQDRVDTYCKAIIGTSNMMALFLLSGSEDGEEPVIEITANGYGDFAKNESLKPTGWQPYSIKIGGKWYSYQYTPLVLGLSFIGNIRDFEKYRGEKLDDHFWTKYGVAARWTARTMLDATAVSSMDAFIGSILDGRDEDAVNKLTKSSARTAKGFVVPALWENEFRRINDWFDNPDKETQGTTMGQVWRNIPFARDAYFNKVNAFGREIPPDADIFVSGAEDKYPGDTKMFQILSDKGIPITAPSFKKLIIKDPKTEQDRFLTQSEFYTFCKVRGKRIRETLGPKISAIRKAPQDEAKEIVSDIVEKAHKYAKGYVLAGNKALYEQENPVEVDIE